MEITAALVKSLREQTGAGFMDCKKALASCDGNVEEAILWLRKKDMIKRAGENVAACEVEYVVSLHPAVQEVAVVGVPDEVRDEAVFAFVILRPDARCTEQDIIDWCAGKLADFKVPGTVRFVPEFPCTSLGKVQKNILKQQALNEPAAGA